MKQHPLQDQHDYDAHTDSEGRGDCVRCNDFLVGSSRGRFAVLDELCSWIDENGTGAKGGRTIDPLALVHKIFGLLKVAIEVERTLTALSHNELLDEGIEYTCGCERCLDAEIWDSGRLSPREP